MNRFVLCLIAAASAAAVASAAPVTCAAPNPSDVTSSASFSYNCGGLTFSNFAVTNAGNQPVGQVNIGTSGYEDIGGSRVVTLNLNPNLTLPASTPAQQADVWLWYQVSGSVTSPLKQIGGVMPQNGAYTETVCSASFAGGVVCPGTQLDQFTVWGPSNNVKWGTNANLNTTTAYVFKDIGGPSPIHTTALAQVFRTVAPSSDVSPAATPEPASMLLIGTGLLVTALFGRRAIKS